MNEVFGTIYTDSYDLLYRDKDYVAECDSIERIFQTYGDGAIQRLLDLGCGTGGHALRLCERGYEVVGVDRSEGMLAHARNKARDSVCDNRVSFQQGDIRNVNLDCEFDAAVMMFAVLGYQLENADVMSALKTARRHLRAGGLFLFDVWYGPAVLGERPSERVKVIPTAGGQILRVASGELDERRHLCTVRYEVWQIEEGQSLRHTQETHRMRYFFPLELEHLLECAGFAPLRLGAFSNFECEPDETTWNVMCAARAV
ncbi:MAG TPA: class I SAM-dependent methyltransferase [Pyrinomonadaceae bacterium]|jgi:SAM-dependent methyltransferase